MWLHMTEDCGILLGCVFLSSFLFLLFTLLWKTAEHLSLTSLGKSLVSPSEEGPGGDRTNSVFKEDESLPTVFRSKLSDYFKSGYDRGHMWVSVWITELLLIIFVYRVPAADAKISQVWSSKEPCRVLTLVIGSHEWDVLFVQHRSSSWRRIQ